VHRVGLLRVWTCGLMTGKTLFPNHVTPQELAQPISSVKRIGQRILSRSMILFSGEDTPEVRGKSDVAVRDSQVGSELNELVARISLHRLARMADRLSR